MTTKAAVHSDELFVFILGKDLSVHLSASAIVVMIAVLAALGVLAIRLFGHPAWHTFDIEEAEFGLGDQKITLRPNDTDRQIAYKIWVELSTRKIGLEIDLDHDVIVEVYDSWYSFFAVTRELIKDIPVRKFRRRDTEKIVRLSIEVLNNGLRPHLTKWQARFRHWYEYQMENAPEADLEPQKVQRKFPRFAELETEIQEVNGRLMKYRDKMRELITSQ